MHRSPRHGRPPSHLILLVALLAVMVAACADLASPDDPPVAAGPVDDGVPEVPVDTGDVPGPAEVPAPGAVPAPQAALPTEAGVDDLLAAIEAAGGITVEQVREVCANDALRALAATQLASAQDGAADLLDEVCAAVADG